jgi:hypothetical protein
MASGLAKRSVTIVPVQSRAPIQRRRSGGGGRRRRGKGVSTANIKARARTKTLALGSLGAFGFGLLQEKMGGTGTGTGLPSVEGIPDTLVYGGIGTVAGVLLKSDTLTQISMGPLFAGLHHLGRKGFSPEGVALGEDDTAVEGEFDSVSGEFDGI